jgi:hypothetical protein
MRLLSQLIKCQNKGLHKFAAYYLSFRGLPLYSPYLTGLPDESCHRALCLVEKCYIVRKGRTCLIDTICSYSYLSIRMPEDGHNVRMAVSAPLVEKIYFVILMFWLYSLYQIELFLETCYHCS